MYQLREWPRRQPSKVDAGGSRPSTQHSDSFPCSLSSPSCRRMCSIAAGETGTSGGRGSPPTYPTRSSAAFSPGTPYVDVTGLRQWHQPRLQRPRLREPLLLHKRTELHAEVRDDAGEREHATDRTNAQTREEGLRRPDENVEVGRCLIDQPGDPADVPTRFLHPNDVSMLRELGHCGGFQTHTGERREVIEEHGNRRRIGNGREMVVKAPVVIWGLKYEGVRTKTASAPRSAARRVAAIAARVDSRPVPTMSSRSRGTQARACAMIASASSSSNNGASPLDPSTTRPVTLVLIQRSMLARRAGIFSSP